MFSLPLCIYLIGRPLGPLSSSSHLSILLLMHSLSLPPHSMSKPFQSDLISTNLHTLITLPSGNLIVQSNSSLGSSVRLIITITNKDTVPSPTYTTPQCYSSHPHLLHVCHLHRSNILLCHSRLLYTVAQLLSQQPSMYLRSATHNAALSFSSRQILHLYYYFSTLWNQSMV